MYETLIHTFSVIKSKFWSLCYSKFSKLFSKIAQLDLIAKLAYLKMYETFIHTFSVIKSKFCQLT